MSRKNWWLLAIVLSHAASACQAQQRRQWSESEVVEQFLAQSPQSREFQSRVIVAEAEARARTVYPNPAVSYSYEGAGYNAFVEASQTLPVNGRIRYLREAGAASVSAVDANREAALWFLRTDLRIAFYRMVGAQERLRVLSAAAEDMGRLIEILRQREKEGEGSRYDRLRAEREVTELRVDMTTARSMVAGAAARLASFMPEGSEVQEVRGELRIPSTSPPLEDLLSRAMSARSDYKAGQRSLARYQMEQQAARRLRIPEPQVSAGVKRADVTSGIGPNPFSNVTRTGVAVSLSVPLPLFNNGRYEVARYQAEEEQAKARIAVLARQIRTEVQGARDVLAIRRDALTAYQREQESAGAELTRITQAAYQEGEVGILELLDSFRITRGAALRALDLEAGVKEALIELERVVGEEVRP